MKHTALVLVLLALLMAASGCEKFIKNDYLSVESHVESAPSETQPPEEETPPVVTNRNELRGTVLSFVRNWTELGTIYVRNYAGDLYTDLDETMRYLSDEDPIGAYAVDYADAELSGSPTYGTIEVRLVFRRSASEIDAIVTVSGHSGAMEKIRSSLLNFDTALTLRIRDYEDADFPAEIRNLCLSSPAQLPVLPEVSASVYPQEGETRILELHFNYAASRDEMRTMQKSSATLLSSASAYVRSGQDDRERMQNLQRYLLSRMDYAIAEAPSDRPAYQLLKDRLASSLGFASVVYAECGQSKMTCRIIEGTRGGESRAWNCLTIDGEECYVDLMRSLELGQTELTLLTADGLLAEGYVWQAAENG